MKFICWSEPDLPVLRSTLRIYWNRHYPAEKFRWSVRQHPTNIGKTSKVMRRWRGVSNKSWSMNRHPKKRFKSWKDYARGMRSIIIWIFRTKLWKRRSNYPYVMFPNAFYRIKQLIWLMKLLQESACIKILPRHSPTIIWLSCAKPERTDCWRSNKAMPIWQRRSMKEVLYWKIGSKKPVRSGIGKRHRS